MCLGRKRIPWRKDRDLSSIEGIFPVSGRTNGVRGGVCVQEVNADGHTDDTRNHKH